MTDKIRIAVLGASGYTGADLVRLAITHPAVEIVALAANQKAGQHMADIWPHFAPYRRLPKLVRADAIDWTGVDAVFGCLPHAASAALLILFAQETTGLYAWGNGSLSQLNLDAFGNAAPVVLAATGCALLLARRLDLLDQADQLAFAAPLRSEAVAGRRRRRG